MGSAPVSEERFEIGQRRTLGGPDIVTAGADADCEARLRGEAEQLAGAETRIEVVASTGGDERLRGVGTGDAPGAIGGRAGGALARMHDHGRERELGADIRGHLAQARLVFADGVKTKRDVNLLGLLEVEPEGDAAELRKLRHGSERGAEIFDGTFLGIAKIKKKMQS